ncbi:MULTISPECIES: hypothetical protein [Streptomyces]|uniref:Uncharacterized protein n=1 Tax=Streptomyces fungicidicus TaxID=68203 RepID=A0ACC7XWW6_9ACTN|nr:MULTISPECIES: hypothetical protein [Streptomyces]MBF4135427.1 hypothetical protein [Streptomyces albidoflavus]NUV74055.1 hypothetical protein [Streptomyces fungicidicus]PAX82537.1 hypothetical protein CLM81_27185 [Streptomyces albidoflavus]PAX86595.1 hypothetical protein CLM82_28765 [Streptomyces albidoflavus]PBO19179.1 hypothetical protein CLM83_07990 [Streptomyces albidoflavus]
MVTVLTVTVLAVLVVGAVVLLIRLDSRGPAWLTARRVSRGTPGQCVHCGSKRTRVLTTDDALNGGLECRSCHQITRGSGPAPAA